MPHTSKLQAVAAAELFCFVAALWLLCGSTHAVGWIYTAVTTSHAEGNRCCILLGPSSWGPTTTRCATIIQLDHLQYTNASEAVSPLPGLVISVFTLVMKWDRTDPPRPTSVSITVSYMLLLGTIPGRLTATESDCHSGC